MRGSRPSFKEEKIRVSNVRLVTVKFPLLNFLFPCFYQPVMQLRTNTLQVIWDIFRARSRWCFSATDLWTCM